MRGRRLDSAFIPFIDGYLSPAGAHMEAAEDGVET